MMQYRIQGRVKKKVISRCLREDWDSKALRVKSRVKNAVQINRLISNTFSKAEKDLYEVKSGDKPLRVIFEPEGATTFKEAVVIELQRLQAEMKAGAHTKLISCSHQIESFTKGLDLMLKDMDVIWFKSFANHLLDIGNEGVTVQKKVKALRSLIARHLGKDKISEELKAFRIPTKKTIRQKLTREELEKLERLTLLAEDQITATRDLFMLQVYLRGIRVGDLLQANCSQFSEGFFKYEDDKTGKLFSIKLIPQAQHIVDRYIGQNERLFPFFKWKRNPSVSAFENKAKRLKDKESCTTIINRHLKTLAEMAGIDKPLSSHIARHTFARMAIDKINNPMITMELLGHSSLAIHQVYLNDLRKDEELDRAADDIFS